MRFVAAATALALYLVPAAGWAHTNLKKSEPNSGAVLQLAPHELRIWFTEPIKVGLSTIEVRDRTGRQVDSKDLHADARENALVHLGLQKDLRPGTYKVSWTAIAQDMHPSKGAFEFQIAPKRD